RLLKGIEKITGKKVMNYPVDLCNYEALQAVLRSHPEIEGIIHFAAFKTVPESVEKPLMYFHNNLKSLIHLVQYSQGDRVPYFVLSSAYSVYGNTDQLTVVEEASLGEAQSPYARTKQMGEQIIYDVSRVESNRFILLRYFDP